MLNRKKIQLVFVLLAWLLLVLGLFQKVAWWYFLLLALAYLVVLFIGSTFLQYGFHVKAYCENPDEKQQKIALTFDDGPHPVTPEILAALKKFGVKATFFCIGKQIEAHPEMVQQAFSQGHLIGNHSYSHSALFDFYGRQKVVQELTETDRLIEKLTGKKPLFFRPPYGVTNPAIRQALALTGHDVIGWSIRSMDGVSKNEKRIYRRIIKQLKPGAVILLHDTSVATVRVLEQLLLFLQANNYQVVSLEELLQRPAYEN